ncbi:putative RNA methyltransferase, partial [Bienertia sinuspersici]
LSKVSRGKSFISKSKSSASCCKTTPSFAQTKEKVIVYCYDIHFNGDVEFEGKYERLFKHGITTTCYCDVATLKALHNEDVVRLFSNVGWRNFLCTKYPTYKRVTLEFFISLKDNVGPRFDDDTILTSKEYDSKGGSSSDIQHQALRYVHRALASTIFGYEEKSKVQRDEVYMLDHMLHAKPINTGAFRIRQMKSIFTNHSTKGKTVLGVLITPIALQLGHNSVFCKIN